MLALVDRMLTRGGRLLDAFGTVDLRVERAEWTKTTRKMAAVYCNRVQMLGSECE